jgi:hypothetical protein
MNTGDISQTTLQFTTVQRKKGLLTSHWINLLWYSRLYVKQWQVFKAHTSPYFIGHKYQTTLVSHHLQFLFASTNVSVSLLSKNYFTAISCKTPILSPTYRVERQSDSLKSKIGLHDNFSNRWINFIKSLLFWVTNLSAGLASCYSPPTYHVITAAIYKTAASYATTPSSLTAKWHSITAIRLELSWRPLRFADQTP